jgi:hypothetical protein
VGDFPENSTTRKAQQVYPELAQFGKPRVPSFVSRSGIGYKRLSRSALRDGELGAESGPPGRDVGFSTNFVGYAPESRRATGSRFSSARDPGCVKTPNADPRAQQKIRECRYGESLMRQRGAPRIKLASEGLSQAFLHSQDPLRTNVIAEPSLRRTDTPANICYCIKPGSADE